ncbi:ribonuclease HI family protein [Terriglobus tenax]|uniref:ribonuclease HI family protein n=1 Tax=Terriglobus tenax TaxID=1111115 RepID=UPI0021DFDEB2|nr:ribonuclease HI family protein [Terriglobus tenax]
MRESTGLFAEQSTKETGWVTAFCDGGARGNPGPSGFGAVLYAPDGTILAELSEFLGFRTNNYAEYSGLLAVLEYAIKHEITHLKVTSDSELMVKQIQGKYKVNSPDLKPLWEEAKRRIRHLKGFEITHALRAKNKIADQLANEAMDRGMKRENKPGAPAPAPLKAIPYPVKSVAPPNPNGNPMLRGFVRDGVVHVLGGVTLPEGAFVKIIKE